MSIPVRSPFGRSNPQPLFSNNFFDIEKIVYLCICIKNVKIMDAESLLSDMLNNEILVEISKGLYEDLGYDEPTVSKLTKNIACRLENGWYRKYNGWSNEKVHCKIGVE